MAGFDGKFIEKIIEKGLFLFSLASIVFIVFIMLFIFFEALPGFSQMDLLGTKWAPVEGGKFGVAPLIAGTLLVTLLSLIIAVPLGISTAVFISEVAPQEVKLFLKSAIELLAGIPSVVYGFFGLIVLVEVLRISFDKPTGESWLAGSILLGVMALPTIISVAEDAISSVPKGFREASYALGATKWQTIWRVVVPSALTGITVAIVLGMGRVIGETIALMMVTGNSAIIPSPLWNVFSQIRTLTSTLGIETGEVAQGGIHFHVLFSLAFLLLVITLAVNWIANYSLNRLRHGNNHHNNKEKMIFELKNAINGNSESETKNGRKLNEEMKRNILSSIMDFHLRKFEDLQNRISRMLPSRLTQKIAFSMLTLSTLVVLFFLGSIIFYIVSNGLGAMSLEFLTQFPKDIGRAGGIFPAIIGSFLLVGFALLMAIPIGIGAGIYLAEYSKDNIFTKAIRNAIECLNGIPSIVFGLFGLAFFVLYLKLGISLVAGSLTLAMMVLPTIILTTKQSFKATPMEWKEGSYSLGATKLQTIRRICLPNSLSGIITGAILSFERAIGETAPIMFTAVVFSGRFLPDSPLDPVMALPFHLFVLSTSVPNSNHNAYGTALVLLMIVIIIHFAALHIRRKFKGRE